MSMWRSPRYLITAALALTAMCLEAHCDSGHWGDAGYQFSGSEHGNVSEVASAAQLQAALHVGQRHIRVVDHMDATNLSPQRQGTNESQAVMFDARYATRSIRGACLQPPPDGFDLQGEWRPGMCLVHVTNHTALSFAEHEGTVWIHNIYMLLDGSQAPGAQRAAISFETVAQMSYIYVTNVTLDARDEGGVGAGTGALYAVKTATGSFGHLEMFVSGVSISTAGNRSAPAYFAHSAGSVALEDSRFDGGGTEQAGVVLFSGDLAVRKCTFASERSSTADLAFWSELGTRKLYTDAPVRVVTAAGSSAMPTVLPYSRVADRLREGSALFITLADKYFVEVQSEVLSLERPAPPLPSPPASTERPASPRAKILPAPQADSAPVGAIVGSVISAACIAVATIWGGMYLYRKRHKELLADQAGAMPASQTAADSESGRLPPTRTQTTVSQPQAKFVELRSGWTASSHRPTHPEREIESSATNHDVAGASVAPQGSDGTCVISFTDLQGTTKAPQHPSENTGLTTSGTESVAKDATVTAVDCTTHVIHPKRAHATNKSHQLRLVEAALEHMRASDWKLAGRWTVLSSKQRRVGGQGLVQWVRDEREQADHVVKFFFGGGAAFRREAELYGREEVREMMAAVVHLEPAGMPCPTSGGRLPPWIVLERGSSLRDWAAIQKPDLLTSAQVLSQILQRLSALHNLGLVHRDIKPANIIWRDAAKAWTLIDFGCVVDTRSGDEATLAYSLPYAAPEVVHALERGDRTMRVHTSLDIWSIGLVTYELLMEERVFGPGVGADEIRAQLAGRQPLPWELARRQQERWKALSKLGMLSKPVLACLSRAPAERPSAQQLLETLSRIFSSVTGAGSADAQGMRRAASDGL